MSKVQSLVAMAALATMGAAAMKEPSRFIFRGYGVFANNGRSRSTKRYPQMIVASPAEIAEWNRNCHTRQVSRREARKA